MPFLMKTETDTQQKQQQTSNKTNNSFKILTERDHILMRPGMYIGSVSLERVHSLLNVNGNYAYHEVTVVPALLKIINEIIDNSVDEAIRTGFKHANIIEVNIDADEVSVKDNGRGIPVVKYDGVTQAELAWTRARAGTSFTDDRTTIGANGVGSFATNCFSKSFIGESSDGESVVEVLCAENCNPELTTSSVYKATKSSNIKNSGTHVRFKPDLDKFGLTEITPDHLDVIKDRLFNISICYPKIKFKFNGALIKTGSGNDIAKLFNKDAVAFSSPDNFLLVFAPAGEDEEFRYVSYVNGLHLKNGGVHIDYVMAKLCAELQPLIKKKWKIDVVPNQIKQHLSLGFWVSGFQNAKFDSQSKERLTNSQAEVRAFLKNLDAEKYAKKILATDNIIMPMIESILYKKELAEKKSAAAKMKGVSKKKIANHITASSKRAMEKTILICEGLSAMGKYLEVRDSSTQGAYALRGKVLNTHGIKKEEITANKELVELMAILGLDLYSPAINEAPDELYEVNIDGATYIAGTQDIILHNNQEIKVSDILSL